VETIAEGKYDGRASRLESLPNSVPGLQLRRAAVDVLQASLNLGEPGSLNVLVCGFVEARDQALRGVCTLLRRK
jgi:hypothetical protein